MLGKNRFVKRAILNYKSKMYSHLKKTHTQKTFVDSSLEIRCSLLEQSELEDGFQETSRMPRENVVKMSQLGYSWNTGS